MLPLSPDVITSYARPQTTIEALHLATGKESRKSSDIVGNMQHNTAQRVLIL